MSLENDKFKSIVHYICRRQALRPETLGAVKLHKILWYTDIKVYKRTGKTLTSSHYKKKPQGPFCVDLDSTLIELQSEGRLNISVVEFYENEKRQYVGIGAVDISNLSEQEKKLLDSEIDHVCLEHTASSISEKSHDAVWELTGMEEEMRPQLAAIRFIPPDEQDIQWARTESSHI